MSLSILGYEIIYINRCLESTCDGGSWKSTEGVKSI